MDSHFLKSLSAEEQQRLLPSYVSTLQNIIKEQNEMIQKQRIDSKVTSIVNMLKHTGSDVEFYVSDADIFLYCGIEVNIERGFDTSVVIFYTWDDWFIWKRDDNDPWIKISVDNVKMIIKELIHRDINVSYGYTDKFDQDILIDDLLKNLETI